ncbi:fumarylacetoacetase [Novosphingobium profundi]|uniref:fumarylacetoacetase n=1 Tax=Novosphingobium profundi TaxID=1774954 RepID=UPI001BDA2706|nr:fumarylacetoacetase [Novosphingobium profundi]MBT0669435.1 fumarylacetoacetase [Novosphingobium profundi]
MLTIDETHDPALLSWVESANDHADFPIQNLPLGVVSHLGGPGRGAIAIGEMVLDLAALAASGLLEGDAQAAAEAGCGESLNALLALGHLPRRALRRAVSALLAAGSAHRDAIEGLLIPMAQTRPQLPARIGDYSDFYVGIHHAQGVGALFRPDQPLLPNYKHIPIGYHGRASTVRTSDTPLVRPHGQIRDAATGAVRYEPTARLDFELELGLWIARGNPLGSPIPLARAHDHMAGLTLLNDWSARDIQAWEYQPLGPFQSKSFLTTVSPWIVTCEALAPFRLAQPARPQGDPRLLPYLFDEADQAHGALGLELRATLASAAMRRAGTAPLELCRTQARAMYWTLGQMVAHHTANGCALESGDLLGTGTISGAEAGTRGSLLEITRGGADPLALPGGETRTFLEDGDEVALHGRFVAPGRRAIGFGACRGIVMPPALV